jgi:YfiH family protein
MPTRRGGHSQGPYASFNLSLGVGDEEAAVASNRVVVRAALGYPEKIPSLLHQVHGDGLVRPAKTPTQADGFLLRAGDPWAAVSAADCAPVAIVSGDGKVGALVHAGWRGALAGIAARAVEQCAVEGTRPRDLRAVIGPCIHACCFPVGPEVARRFDPSLRRAHATGQEAIDLPGAIERSLRDAGLLASRIHVAPDCTACLPDEFFSHRRDQGVTGRHWAFLHLA